MLVAEFAGGDLVGLHAEFGFGSVAGIQEGNVGNAVGQKLDPFDVMVFGHGMGGGTDLHLVAVFGLFNDGNMLFAGAVGGAFLHELHVLATADQAGAAAVEDEAYFAACTAAHASVAESCFFGRFFGIKNTGFRKSSPIPSAAIR